MRRSDMLTTESDKTRENRLRRMADRQGLSIRKSRRRDPRTRDYGTYMVIDPYRNWVVSGEYLTLDDVEEYLTSD